MSTYDATVNAEFLMRTAFTLCNTVQLSHSKV